MCGEEVRQLGQTCIGMIVEIDIRHAWDEDEFLGILSDPDGYLAHLKRVDIGPGNHQKRPRRDQVRIRVASSGSIQIV